MNFKHLAILIPLFLAGCATTTIQQCNPPASLLVTEERLDQNDRKEYTLGETFESWARDINEYNNLIERKNTLTDHIKKHCLGN